MRPVLITSGGCEEAIDGVRSITNFSSGKTGTCIAEYFAAGKVPVVMFCGKKAIRPSRTDFPGGGSITISEFTDFASLRALLEQAAGSDPTPAMIVFAAAVSDFSVRAVHAGNHEYRPEQIDKLDSDSAEKILIELRKNPKLIDSIRGLFPDTCLIAFKLTRNAGTQERLDAVGKLAGHSRADYIVGNDISGISGQEHRFRLYRNDAGMPAEIAEGTDKTALAEALFRLYETGIRAGEE
ncbi:MAG: hypothetical protein JW874_01700 [Spirochaetales bacterium]|nr:hypothetical protein [Spirochaetales bacterium]